MTKLASILGMGIGRNTLLGFLRENGILDIDNNPYSEFFGLGWFSRKKNMLRVTRKGIDAIRELLIEKGWPSIDNKNITSVWKTY